jgi:hypothetical protein
LTSRRVVLTSPRTAPSHSGLMRHRRAALAVLAFECAGTVGATLVEVATKSTAYGPHDRPFCMMLSLLVLAPQLGRTSNLQPVSFHSRGFS